MTRWNVTRSLVLGCCLFAGCLPPVEELGDSTPPVTPEAIPATATGDTAAPATTAAAADAAPATTSTTSSTMQTTPSGLKYKIVRTGTGKTPTARDTVRCHYRGRLVDGTEFDSSYSRGEPTEFPLNGVIAGWTEGLQLISEGGEIELEIPGNLGYGQRGEPRAGIGPNATLLFTVELIEVL